MSVICLVIRVLSIVRIFLGYPYFMAINSVNKTVVGYSSPPEQARLQDIMGHSVSHKNNY